MTFLKILSVLLPLIAAAIALFSEAVKKPWNWVFGGLLLAQLVVSVWLVVKEEWEKADEARKTATTGVLSNDRPFPDMRYEYSATNPPAVRIGQSGTFLTIDADGWLGPEGAGDLSIPRPIFRAMDDSEEYNVYLWMKNGRPRIKIQLFNARHQMVAKVDGDRWSVKREFLWDVNYDDQAFEVRNERDEVQLQIVFYEALIEIAYFNYSPAGAAGWISVDGQAIQSRWPSNELPDIKIKPIFKYPSVEFQGVREPA